MLGRKAPNTWAMNRFKDTQKGLSPACYRIQALVGYACLAVSF